MRRIVAPKLCSRKNGSCVRASKQWLNTRPNCARCEKRLRACGRSAWLAMPPTRRHRPPTGRLSRNTSKHPKRACRDPGPRQRRRLFCGLRLVPRAAQQDVPKSAKFSVKVLIETFEENCARSSLREDQLTMTVAKLIIEFAKEGKREPNRLRDLVLRTCILNNRALAPA